MKRRANIAAGLLHEPALLVLDEPTVGVDPQSRHAILETVRAARGRAASPSLYTTHYMEEAERLCDRVGIIDEGRLVAEGTQRELVDGVGERDRLHVGVAGGDGIESLAARCRALGADIDVIEGDGAVEILAARGRRLLAPSCRRPKRSASRSPASRLSSPTSRSVFLHLTGKALRD